MARYIDADALIKEMKECKYANPCNDYQRGVNASIDIQITGIKHIPGADVVPRSEVERVYYNLQAVLEERAETKQEIAREIFEEIEKILKSWRVEMVGNEFYHKSLVDKSIAELKKKYTEGEK